MPIIACKNISLKSFGKILTLGKGKDFCELSILLRNGNTKVPRTTAIFNLSSATDCPSFKLGLCKAYDSNGKHICYALKSERGYRPAVLPFRRKQEIFWKKITAEEFVAQFILTNALKEKPYTALRFNEAGDFHSQKCVIKAEKIALMLRRFGVKVYCYTSRSDLNFSNCRNLIVSGSGFKKDGVSNVFQIIKNVKNREIGYGVCSGSCKSCSRCQTRGKNTCVLAH